MIEQVRILINKSYECISPDNLFSIKKDNILNSRDDIMQIYKQRRLFISEFREHLTNMSTLIEEIEFCNQQLKRILEKEQGK